MKTNKIRIQLDFSPEAIDHLEELISNVDVSTRAELFKNALWTHEWLVHKALAGRGLNLAPEDLSALVKVRRWVKPAETQNLGDSRNSSISSVAC